jgi:hypothetical protein
MTNTRRLLILTVVVAMALALAMTATTAAPNCPTPGHWSCDPGTTTTTEAPPGPEPVAGQTCAESPYTSDDPDFNRTWDGSGTLTHTFLPGDPGLCIDLSNDAAATLTITVTDSKNATGVFGGVRDSVPGDWCGLFEEISLRKATTGSTSLLIPAGTIDACGTGYSDDASSLVVGTSGGFSGRYKPGSDPNIAYIDIEISMSP